MLDIFSLYLKKLSMFYGILRYVWITRTMKKRNKVVVKVLAIAKVCVIMAVI